MKYFITGGQGFVGRHLITSLGSRDKFCNYDLENGDDILDFYKLYRAMAGFDVVVHLAAQVGVPDSWKTPMSSLRTNVEGTQTVVKAAIENGVKKIIFASSAAVYEPLSSPYALGKKTCEDIIRMNGDKLNYAVCRFYNIYGKGQNPKYSGLFTKLLEALDTGEFTLYGSGEQTRDFIHVDDVVNTIKGLAYMKDMPSTIFDVGTGTETKVNEIVKRFKMYRPDMKIIHAPERIEVKESVADIDAMRRLGFRTKIQLKGGIKRLCTELE